ncbi:hypothetical protein DL765_007286 [Monosporascus sp. GIB2]|nr:hypothetical protein DL765_007286 [Monosporascus sp. GIB2]
MCKYNAFYYQKCKKNHVKYDRIRQCWTNQLSLDAVNPALYCSERIVNGDPNVPRKFPSTDDICPICCPKEASAQQEERKKGKKT